MEEIEVKFLNVDTKALEAKFIKLGAKKLFEITYRVNVFDYPDLRLNSAAAWVRLRDEGDKTKLSYKQRLGVKSEAGSNDDSMIEYEVEVSDFDTTVEIMRRIGLIEKFQEEKHRTRYVLDGVELDLDEMPLIAPYLEIEAKSWQDIDKTVEKLGLDPNHKKICSAFQIYEQAGINMLDYKILKFDHHKPNDKS